MDQLYFVVHTHWDREWYQPFQQMRARLVAMADRMIPLVERGEIPFFHFDGQTIVLEDYLELRPEMAARLRKLIRAGKVQVGPWYVLADSFLVSGESLIRNLEIGMAQARRFGRSLDAGYLPDQFGHIAQLPQILAGFGFSTAVLWRGVGADVTRNRFAWEAPDGSAVTTIYLPHGYSNGANLPLDTVEHFLERANHIAAAERPFAGGSPILVMNGTDHAPPDPRLVARIREVRERSPMSFEIGTLEGYIGGTNGAGDSAAIPRHRGELRSPLRAHLLPGVTSARTWIKQRDFANSQLLERMADPLAALALMIGAGGDYEAFLDLAWHMTLQNHPHDSICGCSVDQVHEEMRYRFDQSAIVANGVVRRASEAILARSTGGEPALTVFNPSFARRSLVSGETELDEPAAAYSAVAADGRRFPVAVDLARPERPFDVSLPGAEFKGIVAGLGEPVVMGRTVHRYEMTHGAGGVELRLYMGKGPASAVDLAEFRRRVTDEVPDTGAIHIVSINPARCTLSFVADGLTQAGFTSFRLMREPTPALTSLVQGNLIRNEFYEVRAGARGLQICDLRRGAEMEIYFEDDGDRGDEYNFDPVSGAGTITEPTAVETQVLESGPARSRIRMRLSYAVPAGLAGDRRSREVRTEPLEIELTAALYAGLDRIDFDAHVTNRSRDHRLRAALRVPVPATEAVQDTAFGVLRRPLDRSEPQGTEDIYPTAPHRTWTGVEGDTLSAAIISRGLYEAEVRSESHGSSLLLTLLRCVGWLSRSDLATRRGGAGPEIETPGAQELGKHRFEFAITTWAGSYLDAGVVQTAAAYACPPRAFPAGGGAVAWLIGCNNPRVVFSTARHAARGRSVRMRAYSASPNPETARFTFPEWTRVRTVDLAGRRVAARMPMRRLRGGAIELEMRPFQVVTFEVTPRASRG
jgi:2-O-(6-phospho-alpha-D-mannosyl)-D-glycerate hydrolase